MNAFELFGTIAINNDKANRALDETSGKAHNLASSLGNAFSAVGRTVAKGLIASVGAISALITSSVKNYADYEQLVGGVETLFKDSSAAVLNYANIAYETAGVSANKYMETVTSFSASLLQGLGGDTAEAARIADMALIDMSDNANKMGTSMEMIQNAYQGFAKQNYTMLDNLKLGYGGTMSEMARLINDSGVLGDKFKATANNLRDIPFDMQIKAIHEMQKRMGITGTTALEASTTISGSWRAMSAAWTNLVVGIADDTQDFDLLISNFADSAVTAFTNISNRVPSIVKGVNQLIRGLAPKIPGIIQDLLPGVVEGAIGLISGLAMALPGLMQILIDMLPSIMMQIASAVETVFPILLESVQNLIEQIDFAALGETIGLAFVDLVNRIPELLMAVGNAISYAWSNVVWPFIQGLFKAVFGVELPNWDAIAQSISDGWNLTVWPAIQNFFLQNFEIELPDWETIKTEAVTKLTELSTAISSQIEPALTLLTGAFNGIVGVLQQFVAWITSGSDSADTFMAVVIGVTVAVLAFKIAMGIKALIEGVTTAITAAKSAFALFNAVLHANPIVLIVSLLAGLVAALVWLYNTNETARTIIDTAWASIKSIIDTCCQAINTAIQTVLDIIDSLKTAWNNLVEALTPISTSVSVHYSSSGTLHGGGEGRAFATGAVFDKPTIFDTRIGKAMVGEAGPEAVAPISVLQGYVSDAVARQNAGLVNALDRVVDSIESMNENMGSNLRAALNDTSLKINNREFGRLVRTVT